MDHNHYANKDDKGDGSYNNFMKILHKYAVIPSALRAAPGQRPYVNSARAV
jgi:hypothetical protein